MNHLSFAQMLCSRLCHDLITPIGAVNTGIELLADCTEADRVQLITLSQQSAETASRRLVYYRAAFGYSAASHITSLDAFDTFVAGFLTPIKIHLIWQEKPSSLEPLKESTDLTSFVRILLNLVLVAAEAAPFGGNLSLSLNITEEGWMLEMAVTDNLVEIRTEVQAALKGNLEEEHYSPHTVQALMTHMLLRDNEVEIDKLSSTKKELVIRIKKQQNCQSLTAMLF